MLSAKGRWPVGARRRICLALLPVVRLAASSEVLKRRLVLIAVRRCPFDLTKRVHHAQHLAAVELVLVSGTDVLEGQVPVGVPGDLASVLQLECDGLDVRLLNRGQRLVLELRVCVRVDPVRHVFGQVVGPWRGPALLLLLVSEARRWRTVEPARLGALEDVPLLAVLRSCRALVAGLRDASKRALRAHRAEVGR